MIGIALFYDTNEKKCFKFSNYSPKIVQACARMISPFSVSSIQSVTTPLVHSTRNKSNTTQKKMKQYAVPIFYTEYRMVYGNATYLNTLIFYRKRLESYLKLLGEVIN